MATVVLSRLPPNCQDGDVRRALVMFGTAIEVRVNQRRREAIVILSSQQEAERVVQQAQIHVAGTVVPVRRFFLNEETAPQQPPPPPQQQHHPHHMQHQHHHQQPQPQYSAHFPSPPQQQQQQQQSYLPQTYGQYQPPPPPPQQQQPQGMAPYSGGGPCRLSVTVENCRHPITRDVLTLMFQSNLAPGEAPPRYVYCGPSGNTTYGEVEFADAAAAEKAVREFNGRSIYPDCCHVRLAYKPAPPPPAPAPNPGLLPQPYGMSAPPPPPPPLMPPMYTPPSAGFDPYYNAPGGMGGGPYGGGGRGGGMGRGRGGAAGAPFGRGGAGPMHGGRGGRGMTEPEPAVMVSGVAETVPLYDLWVLLEVYGNVYSLKRQYKDPTNVVATFQHLIDARSAVEFLQNLIFRGNKLTLRVFRNFHDKSRPEDWEQGDPKEATTMAASFRVGYHHNTNPHAPYNSYGRVPVSNNLYVFNLIDEITDDEVRRLFTSKGLPVTAYYRKNSSSAVVGFPDTDTAIAAIVAIQGEDNNVKQRFLRISFSRIPPGPKPEPADKDKHNNNNNSDNAEDGEEGPHADDEQPDGETAPAAPAEAPADADANGDSGDAVQGNDDDQAAVESSQ